MYIRSVCECPICFGFLFSMQSLFPSTFLAFRLVPSISFWLIFFVFVPPLPPSPSPSLYSSLLLYLCTRCFIRSAYTFPPLFTGTLYILPSYSFFIYFYFYLTLIFYHPFFHCLCAVYSVIRVCIRFSVISTLPKSYIQWFVRVCMKMCMCYLCLDGSAYKFEIIICQLNVFLLSSLSLLYILSSISYRSLSLFLFVCFHFRISLCSYFSYYFCC